ncbi:MAG: antibiotic biosynthesis monooxygenase family protein [Myxococcota bacterium]
MKFVYAGAAVVTVVALVLLKNGCTVARPFSGPGLSALSDSDTAPDTVIVALTHAVVDTAIRGDFDDHTMRVAEALDGFDGFIGYSIRKELLGDEAWTMTVWADRDALDRFVESPIHQRAIAAGESALRQARFHTFEVAATEIPLSWDRALAILDENQPRDPVPDL